MSELYYDTYENLYAEGTKGIIRSEGDAHIACMVNGRSVKPGTWPPQTYEMVCDRKWGEFTRTTSIDILFGLRLNPSSDPAQRVWIPQDIPAGDFWWAGITSSADRTRLESFGTTIVEPLSDRSKRWWGDIGTIRYEPTKFNYEVVALYTDNSATVEVQPPSNVYVSTTKSQYYDVLGIWGTAKFIGPFYFWKCRITKIA